MNQNIYIKHMQWLSVLISLLNIRIKTKVHNSHQIIRTRQPRTSHIQNRKRKLTGIQFYGSHTHLMHPCFWSIILYGYKTVKMEWLDKDILSVINKCMTITNKIVTKRKIKKVNYPKSWSDVHGNHQKSMDTDRCTVLSIAARPRLVVGPS